MHMCLTTRVYGSQDKLYEMYAYKSVSHSMLIVLLRTCFMCGVTMASYMCSCAEELILSMYVYGMHVKVVIISSQAA